jgi:tetratricopeptide (TPR) repeat protein
MQNSHNDEYDDDDEEMIIQKIEELNTLAKQCISRGRYQAAIECYEQVIELNSEDANPLVHIGDIHMNHLNDCSTALQQYQSAFDILKYSERSMEQIQRMQDVRVRIARAMYQMGNEQPAIALVTNVLKENNENFDALVEYAYCLIQNKHYANAIPILLKCLLKENRNIRVKKLIVSLLQNDSVGAELFINYLMGNHIDNSDKLAALLALISKEYSTIGQSIQLFRYAIELNPDSASYVLNLIHTLEIQLKYRRAITEAVNYFKNHSQLHVGGVYCSQILEIIESLVYTPSYESKDYVQYRSGIHAKQYADEEYNLQWIETHGISHAQLSGSEQDTIQLPDLSTETPYSIEELDLLAIYFSLVKILFVMGVLSPLPSLIHLIEKARVKNYHTLHKTAIKNEFAYFRMIAQIMTDLSPKIPIPENIQPLYVCGDSHSLSPAWQCIKYKSEQRVITPVLVTGMKCWHLHEHSHHYPKVNFEHSIPTILSHSQVIFMFGEIDCREGILTAVDKGKYENVEHALQVVVDVYLNKLEEIQNMYHFEIMVHPVLPIQTTTEAIVDQFNQIMALNIARRNRFKWLGSLIASEVDLTAAEYKLDGTHIHPRYISLLQKALEE